MEGRLVFRIVVCLASLFVSIWLLLPTFLGKEVQDTLQLAADRAKLEEPPPLEQPLPWWVQWLPNKRVNLGLDLQGGIDLTLDVDVDEAVRSTVQRDVGPLKQLAERDGIKLADVRRDKRRPALLIAAGEGTTLEQVRTLVRGRFPGYLYDHTETIDGVDYLAFNMTEERQAEISKNAVAQALETIRNRIDETGVKEPSITQKGVRGIDVQLPGESNVEQAKEAVGTTARLEFMLVDEEADFGRLRAGISAAEAAMPPEEFAKDEALDEWMHANGHLAADRRLLWEYEKTEDGMRRKAKELCERGGDWCGAYPLKDEVLLTGDDINDARTEFNGQDNQFYVQMIFKPRGQAIFAEVTGDNVGKRFAIVLDDQVRSAPNIQTRIDGPASITMGTANLEEQNKEASMLALVLRSGSLPAPVQVGEVREVGPSLGERAIREGIYAALIGSVLVFLFAGIYYRVSGLLADITLVLNGLLVVALLALVGATLTLPGICGIALTIGMAVDANIIIYERIREELRAGKGVRAAIELGFEHATVAVLDSNVSAMLAGVVLYSYGTGPIRGFGVTLLIGIVTTLFTAIFVARTLMELVNSKRTTISI